MKILVSTAALRIGGAKTIYEQFISHLYDRTDNNQYLIIVDSSMKQPVINDVKYVVVNIWGKVRRYLFDHYKCKVLLKKLNFNPDLVISLQNTGVNCLKNIQHIIYYHQALPFYQYHWNPFAKKEREQFFYKNIYPFFFRHSFGANADFVVQTPYIKEGLHNKFGLERQRIHVMFPDIDSISINDIASYPYKKGYHHFIYVALYTSYKGHEILVKALKKLKELRPELLRTIQIHLTLSKEECPALYKQITTSGVSDNFIFDGHIQHETLFSMYKSSNGLLFPSKIETIGLPLIEAASLGINIIVSDLPYAHEALHSYLGAKYIKPDDYTAWARQIAQNCIENESFPPLKRQERSQWEDFFNLVETKRIK